MPISLKLSKGQKNSNYLLLFLFLYFSLSYAACSSPSSTPDGLQKPKEKNDSKADAGFIEQRGKEKTPPEKRQGNKEQTIQETAQSTPDRNPQVLYDGMKVKVKSVIDGDTIYVYAGNQKEPYYRVRLLGMNTPECFKDRTNTGYSCIQDKDYYGLAAHQEMVKLVWKPSMILTVYCPQSGLKGKPCRYDPYRRFLAYLLLPNGENISEKMLLAGTGWVFTTYHPVLLGKMCEAEAKAIKAKAGMWKDGRPAAKAKMSASTQRWYYHSNPFKTHDAICSKAMGTDFAKAAGEK